MCVCSGVWTHIHIIIDRFDIVESIVAIEVNPRLTTSYLGLRDIIVENLAGLVFQAALGQCPEFSDSGRSIVFDSFGTTNNDKLH